MKYVLASLLLALPLFTLAQPDNPTIQRFAAEKLFQRGLERYQAKDFAGAISLFNEVVLQDPRHPEVYEFRGEAYYLLGDYRAAVDDYDEALRQEPDQVELLNSAGVAAAKLQLYGAAIQYFKRALKVNPSHDQAKINLEEAKRRYQLASGGRPVKPGDRDPFSPGTNGGKPLTIIDLGAYSIARGPGVGGVNFSNPREQSFDRPGNKGGRQKEKIYGEKDLEIGGQSDPNVRLIRVKQSRSQTEVALMVKNAGKDAFLLKFANPGEKESAFFLTDAQFQYIYQLKSIRGPKPRRTGEPYELRPNEEVLVVATFERMRDDVKAFNLIEGEKPSQGAWNFWHVEFK